MEGVGTPNKYKGVDCMEKLIAIIFALLLVISLSNYNSNNTRMTKEEYNRAVENNTLREEIRKDLREEIRVIK